MMRRILLMLMGFFLCAVPAQSEEFSLVTLDWEPYSSQSQVDKGLTTEIVTEALKRKGHKVSITFLPWLRAANETLHGSYDALLNAYNSAEREAVYGVSDSYMESPVELLVRADSDIEWDGNLKTLSRYSFGIVAGYMNSVEFDAADYLKKFETPTEVNSLNMLFAKHVDIVVLDRFVAIHLLTKHPEVNGGLGDVRFLSIPLACNSLHVMFSKARPGWEKRLADFNEGLHEIIEDGTVQRILHEYGVWQSQEQ